ncbi:hypothetical protein QR98_0080860 [Sarcoptes scabiei]|uniref:Uncharacterized protein n=1 Tax=Sarcoptes scabiei TaxID=52283 RepID=A0A132AFB8_SARSC|nr:hypothetical protein QR98_0080860 [Sarcoptes scabiei]
MVDGFSEIGPTNLDSDVNDDDDDDYGGDGDDDAEPNGFVRISNRFGHVIPCRISFKRRRLLQNLPYYHQKQQQQQQQQQSYRNYPFRYRLRSKEFSNRYHLYHHHHHHHHNHPQQQQRSQSISSKTTIDDYLSLDSSNRIGSGHSNSEMNYYLDEDIDENEIRENLIERIYWQVRDERSLEDEHYVTAIDVLGLREQREDGSLAFLPFGPSASMASSLASIAGELHNSLYRCVIVLKGERGRLISRPINVNVGEFEFCLKFF